MKTATRKAAFRPGPGLGDGVLVDPGWLAGHLNDADPRTIEVDVSPAAYDDWHIDGAVLWNIYTYLKDAGYRTATHPAAWRRYGQPLPMPAAGLRCILKPVRSRGPVPSLMNALQP